MADQLRERLIVLAPAAAAVALLLGPPGAGATLPAGNLVSNPGAEAGQGARDSSTIIPPPQWTVTGQLTAIQYGTSGFPSQAVSSSIGGGANFFSGGNATPSTGEQVIDVGGAAQEIDAGGVVADLSADLGGFAGQDDNAAVVAAFQDQSGASRGSIKIGPVTAADRAGRPDTTTLLPRAASTSVPAGTRTVRLTLTVTRVNGTYNDGYADNVSLVLKQGLSPPAIGKTANAEADAGTVLVKLPGGGGFVALANARQVPVGAVFDTTKGTLRLTTAANGTGSAKQEGLFSGGQFVVQQTKKNPLTTLSMTGGKLGGCKTRVPSGGSPKDVAGAAARRRTLFSNVKGRFRTRGRHSSATVRGTQWRMTDTCAGTLTTVKKGSVVVRDFRLRKNKVVTAGHKYLARAK